MENNPIQSIGSSGGEKWLSMSEAALGTPYSAEYLSLLARKNKLGAKKIDNTWFTTRQVVDDYMKRQMIRTEVQNGNLPKPVSGPVSMSVSQPASLVPQSQASTTLRPIRSYKDDHNEYQNRIVRETPHVAIEQALEKVIDKKIPHFDKPSLKGNFQIPNIGIPKSLASGTLMAIISLTILPIPFVSGFFEAGLNKVMDAVSDARTVMGFRPGTHENELLLLDKEGNIAIMGHVETDGQLRSNAANGVAPIVVDSATLVANLNADMLDNLQAQEFTLAFVTKNGGMTTEDVQLYGNVEVGKTLLVKGATKLLSELEVDGELRVFGEAEFKQALRVLGPAEFEGVVTMMNNVSMKKNLNVRGSVVSGSSVQGKSAGFEKGHIGDLVSNVFEAVTGTIDDIISRSIVVDGLTAATSSISVASTTDLTAASSTLTRLTFELATGTSATTTNFYSSIGNFQTLSVAGDATVTGDFTVAGDTVTIGQLLSTRVPTLPHVFTTWPAGTSNASDATIYINPASAAADTNIFAAAVGGVVKFLVDAEGDMYANNLVLAGSTSLGETTVAGNLAVQDAATLGDASSDLITLNGQLLALASTTLQNFTFANATGTAATTTSFFSTTASSTNLFATALVAGNSTLGTLTAAGITASGNILASTGGLNIGTSGTRFGTIYADTVDATSLTGTVVSGSTSANDWLINSDNATADTENMTLGFERGSLVPNALLTWNATSDRFEFNSDLFVGSGIGNGTLLVNGSTTLQNFTFVNATGTSATTTSLYGSVISGFGLTSCNSGTNALTWSSGSFGCHSIPSTDKFSTSTNGLAIYPNAATALVLGGSATTTANSMLEVLGNFYTSGTVTSGLINGQTISSAANFTGTLKVEGEVTLGTNAVSHGIINAPESFRINFDSDNTASSNSFSIGANGTGLAGGSSYLTVLDGGNVGIGTTAPQSHLVVYDAAGIGQGALRVLAGSGEATLGFASGNADWNLTTSRAFIGLQGWGLGADKLGIGDENTAKVVVDVAGGNVGIGTTTPAENLTVDGTIQFGRAVSITGGAANIYASGRLGTYNSGTAPYSEYQFIQPAKGKAFAIWNANSNIVAAFGATGSDGDYRSFFNGNVGIGLTGPSAKLDIQTTATGVATIKSAVSAAGQNFLSAYGTGANYAPGITWSTSDNSAGIPKTGIWSRFTGAGSYIEMGTSNSYVSGITNTALSIDPSGNTTLSGTLAVTGTISGNLSGQFNNGTIYSTATNPNTINSGYGTAADDADIWINYRGYNDAQAFYRDFRIGNGRGTAIAFFDGSRAISRFDSGAAYTSIDSGFASSHGYSTGNWGVRLGATGSAGVIQAAQDSQAYPLSLNPYGGAVTIGGNTAWHAGNDGSGSTLDADTLDTLNSTAFLRAGTQSPAGNAEIASDNNSSTSYSVAALELRETSYGGSSAYLAPRLGFHWGGVVASQITIESDGTIAIKDNPGTSYEKFKASTFYGAGTGLTGTAASLTVGDLSCTNCIGATEISDGAGSGLSADTLDGLELHTGTNNEANKVVRTDANGYVNFGWINTISGSLGTDTAPDRYYSSNDAYIRYTNPETTKMNLGLSYKNTYRRRTYTTDSNYWVGSIGDNTTTPNQVFHGGSGFFDTWGAGATYPSGTSHIQGINALHYSSGTYGVDNGANAYGIQIAGQYNQSGTIFTRGVSAGTFGTWYKIWSEANDGAGSGLDADLWDGNNFASYLNQAVLSSSAPTFAGVYLTGGGATDRLVNVNTSGFGIDALNNGSWDLLVYNGGSLYFSESYYGYGGTAYLRTYDTNENLNIDPNGSGSVDVESPGTSVGYWLDGQAALTGYTTDQWLRLNQNSSFTSGVYTPGLLRTDGGLVSGALGGLGAGTVHASGEVRAPTFYDYNDTAYYVDPNGTSVQYRILLPGRASDWGAQGEVQGNYIVSNTSMYAYGGICSGTASGDCNGAGQITALGTISGSDYVVNGSTLINSSGRLFADTINTRTTNDPLEINYDTTGPVKICATASCLSVSALFNTNASVNFYSYIFATAMYDADSTGYVIDPHGTSNLANVVIETLTVTGCFNYSSCQPQSDLAESFPLADSAEAGDLLAIAPGEISGEGFALRRAQSSDSVIGIISTSPAIVLEGDKMTLGATTTGAYASGDKVPVALAGRVPVKFSEENGPINAGDYLTVSPTQPGKAVKAVSAGQVIGQALTSSETSIDGRVLAYVTHFFYTPATTQNIASVSTTTPGFIESVLETLGATIVNGVTRLASLIVDSMSAYALTVGRPEQPAGITIYDEDTGEPYCMKVKSGQQIAVAGVCGSQVAQAPESGGGGGGTTFTPIEISGPTASSTDSTSSPQAESTASSTPATSEPTATSTPETIEPEPAASSTEPVAQPEPAATTTDIIVTTENGTE